MPESDIGDRIQRLETQTTRLKAVVLLLAVQILWSGGIKDAMAQFRARMKPAAIVGKRPARHVGVPEKPPWTTEQSAASEGPRPKQAGVLDLVQARRIQIVNRSGDVIVDLAESVGGSGIIAGYDNLGNNVFYAGVSGVGGGYLALQDGSGNVRVLAIAGADEDDTSRIRIRRSNGDDLVYAGGSLKGDGLLIVGGGERSGFLTVENESNEKIVTIGPDENGNGFIGVSTSDGRNLVVAGATGEGTGGILTLRNRAGIDLVRLAAGSEDGALLIDNATENNLVFLGGSTGGAGQLRVNRPDGGNMVYAGDDIEGDGFLTIDNRNGTELFTLGANLSGNALFRASNANGELGLVGIAGNEAGDFSIVNREGIDLVTIRGSNGDGLIESYSSLGTTIWSSSTSPIGQRY